MNRFWEKVLKEVRQGNTMILLYVLHSEGSSPGRRGFKMGVSTSGELLGSIGGGIMEHKWVEWCRASLLEKPFRPFLKRQVHQAEIGEDRSGMICSGEQTVAFYHLGSEQLDVLQSIVENQANGTSGVLHLSEKGLQFAPAQSLSQKFEGSIENEQYWTMAEDIGLWPTLHIIGGGHVGLALSQLAQQLAFRVKVYDDRLDLNTMAVNSFAECRQVKSYETIGELLPQNEYTYVVLMSFGYRTDKLILQQILGHSFRYLGMMGSQAKVEQLLNELQEEGYSSEQLARVYAPIGLSIHSQTPAEIAVSIMAEIIRVKNTRGSSSLKIREKAS